MPSSNNYLRRPSWLKVTLPPAGAKSAEVMGLLSHHHLNTICQSGMCPNRGECWRAGTATFMIGGAVCTRSCRFCNVTTGRPSAIDPAEIEGIIDSIRTLGIHHAVITSVDRDDLPDLGARHWADTIRAIHEQCPGVTMEVLIPDMQGRLDLVDIIIAERPDVISHNLETVRRLTPEVRCRATYDTSLSVLRHIAASGIPAKSGIMLGLGEEPDEVLQTMDDLLEAGVSIMTIGQYLQPTHENYPVMAYITPEQFAEYGRIGRAKGFRHIESAPLVRSSYHAERHIH